MFATHKLNEKGFKEMAEFKTKMSMAVSEALLLMPTYCQYKDIFKAKVEEAVYFGATAIAGNPENFTERICYPEVAKLKD